ncbi:MAG TPA: hypothetical protein PLZ15_11945 [Melioribacteraceae bacterium]|nr:hypothetical protein [Melioribacteraceae bacterium]
MKRIFSILILSAILIAYSDISAQTQNPPPPKEHGKKFVDKNGDGYNDNAPDHDGDGIPNGLDPDYLALKNKNAHGRFVDLDGDGIKDNASGKGRKGKMGQGGIGPADGTGNKGIGKKYGNSDGTGDPAQNTNRGGKKWGKK